MTARALLQQALRVMQWEIGDSDEYESAEKTITAIREYLDKTKEQEPFGYICNDFNDGATTLYEVKQESVLGKVYRNTTLYLHPTGDE